MKTVLIVEDEKMIRQGIRTMVQRSGVQIDTILECSNGLMALGILKDQVVDLMFTDIRMPKMDGITLVNEVQKLEHVPEIVAVSGYDDFSYAVEMLRHGVREYILKPVERQKITDILVKIDAELAERSQKMQTDRQLGIAQIKHLLTDDISEEELGFLVQKYGDVFFKGGYKVIAAGKNSGIEERDGIMGVHDIRSCSLYVVAPQIYNSSDLEDICSDYCGISREHTGIPELKAAYEEAMEARKAAFFRMKSVVSFGDPLPKAPQGLIDQEKRLVTANAWTQRLHLIGTERTEELDNGWNVLFEAVKKGHVEIADFESGMQSFLAEMKNVYRNVLMPEDEKKLENLTYTYAFSDVEEYRDEVMELIFDIHSRINNNPDDSKNQQKIKRAIAYIDANFDQDLNMAVVSNEISMNYSLFSIAFKEVTGKNFVNYLRDLRMEQAKRLLSETDMKVIEISAQVGYENEKHFMKVFKQVYGVSPSEYRKIMNKDA